MRNEYTTNEHTIKGYTINGYTIMEVIIVVIIASILAVMAIPSFKQIIRRSEMREVRNVVDAVRAGARQYVLKQDTIATLALSSDPDPSVVWDQLNVDLPDPDDAICTYTIVTGGTTDRRLQVDSSGTWLYLYDLPDGPGTLNSETNNPDARYVHDLP